MSKHGGEGKKNKHHGLSTLAVEEERDSVARERARHKVSSTHHGNVSGKPERFARRVHQQQSGPFRKVMQRAKPPSKQARLCPKAPGRGDLCCSDAPKLSGIVIIQQKH